MSDNASLRARREAATPRGVGISTPFFVSRAENSELWDVEGRRYIDFAGGIAVLNTGHRHPRVVAALRAQLDAFTHTAYQVAAYESYVALAERLIRLTPGGHAKKATFFSTGAEAVENAVKIARAATGRPGVVAFSGAFHGRTMMGMALTGKVVPYKVGFGPFPGDVWHIPFPMKLHGVTTADSLEALHRLFKADVDPRRVAAIIIEPVQGEGGFYPAPPELLQALRAECDEHGILLIADEIQTGFARTGRMFAMFHHQVQVDLMTVAKSLGAGLPISGVVGRAEVMDAPAPGGLGGTYAGNPLATAAAHAVLDVIAEERLEERATLLGGRLSARLSALAPRVPQLAEVRGPGAMLAAEFMKPGGGGPDPDFAKLVQGRALEQGLVLLTCGVHANVLRFLFPLTIQDAVFEEGLGILERSLLA
ncbi:MAG: 4-aminobutyrate--2-oxoglutarate transaminase [Anaeromyxobacter sp.]|nr:4-aminobutyrate--2-oxoglutarate transaminase [Anaeromyxobacter sp.]MBL0276752.1 4-aminobutyrate--2-oxoglutarate transaminase [Anaeromyxobacter sp.]